MPVLYVTAQGATVHRKGETLVVRKRDEDLARVTTHDLDAVVVFGRGHLTTDATRLLLRQRIPTAFLTARGRLLGRLTPPAGKNAARRIAQMDMVRDAPARLAVARRIVQSKLRGTIELLQDFAGNHPSSGVADGVPELRGLIERSGRAGTLEELRGVEGTAARAYFRSFGAMCRGDLRFEKRTRRPPRDPMNALLSFGYVLVGQELVSLLDAVGLDPYLGLYHDVAYGRPSLALDLVEEFRRPVVDRLALKMNNLGMLTCSDFRSTEQRGCRLKPPSLKRYLRAYEDVVRAQGPGPSYRRLFRRQVERLAGSFDDGGPYVPHNAGSRDGKKA